MAALILALNVSGAFSKIIDHERAQIVLLPILQPARLALGTFPEERTLRAGDLISVFVSDKAELRFFEKGEESTTLVPLDEEHYRELSLQGGGHVAEPGFPSVRGYSWKRFGAARPGIVHFQIRQAGEFKWFRFDITAAPEFKYGSVVHRTDADQSAVLSLTDYDQLVLDLPGEVGDGWSVRQETGHGLKLVSLSQAASHRVTLTLTVLRQDGEVQEQTLLVTSASKQFNFVWRRIGVPLSP